MHRLRRQRSGLGASCAASALTCVLELLAAGCARSRGPDHDAAGAGAPRDLAPIPEAEFEAEMARAHCQFEDRCCRRVGLPGVVDSCEQIWRSLVADDRPSPSSGARYDDEAAAACIAELAAFDCPHAKELASPWPEPCGRIYRRGDLQLGERCSKPGPYECALADSIETACWWASAVGTYECVPVEERGEGEPCRDAETVVRALITCAPPLQCEFDRSVCARVPELGEPCAPEAFGGDTCARGSVCDPDGGRCVAPVETGAPCVTGATLCEAGRCIAGRCREPIRYSVELCAKP